LISRARFSPFYHVIQATLGTLVVKLSDQDVMEYVSGENVLTVPLAQQGSEKPMPCLEIELGEDVLRIALVYRNAECLRHLKNILHPSQMDAQGAFTDSMRTLPVAFETRLSKRGFKETDFVLVKKYVASRVDTQILSLLIEEAEAIRTGGRRTVDGRSIYEAPATPTLYLLFKQVKPSEVELQDTIAQMKQIIILALSVKTQREIIHSHISKPVDQANQYRRFVELLNKARSLDAISAEERRRIDKRWREVLEERGPLEEDLKRRIGYTKQ
jgi:hypothetical protein